jgi:hypothetical protein
MFIAYSSITSTYDSGSNTLASIGIAVAGIVTVTAAIFDYQHSGVWRKPSKQDAGFSEK